MVAAIVSLVVALLGLAVAIWIVVELMLPEEVSLAVLVGAESDPAQSMGTLATRYPELLFGYGPTMTALKQQYHEALQERRAKLEANWAVPPTATDDEATASIMRVKAIGQAVEALLAVALYEALQSKWKTFRFWLFIVALVVAGAIATFAWASNPPPAADDGVTPAALAGSMLHGTNLSGQNLSRFDLSRATLARADLRGADMSQANLSNADLAEADLRGADLTNANLTNADLTSARLSRARVTGVAWNNTICPDGTLSDDGPGGTCLGHQAP